MNEASQWRLEVARFVAPIIARNPHVAAVMLGGSASRSHADSYSDIEIGVFWELDPNDPVEAHWMEEWGLGGVKMDMRNLTVDGVERMMNDVLEQADTTDFKQFALSAIQYGIPLYNHALIQSWQKRLACPKWIRKRRVQLFYGGRRNSTPYPLASYRSDALHPRNQINHVGHKAPRFG
jgi:hypothetical protein